MSSIFSHKDDMGLADELDRCGVMSPQDWNLMDGAGSLRAVPLLLKNPGRVKAGPWKAWLVRNHGCLPLASVKVGREWAKHQSFSENLIAYFRAEGVVPVERVDGGWLLAIMVPVNRATWAARMGKKVFLLASSPAEIATNLAAF